MAALPSATTQTTAAMPMVMPSEVKALLILLRGNALMASRKGKRKSGGLSPSSLSGGSTRSYPTAATPVDRAMSKAFTREEDGISDSEPIAAPRRRSERKRPITAEGRARLEHELDSLQTERAQSGREPVALENSVRLKELERRILTLSAVLEDTQVREVGSDRASHAAFGAWITLEDEEGGRVTYQIVGPDEAAVSQGRLSVESPLAQALIGHSVDEWVTVERPRGTTTYRIASVANRKTSGD